MNKRFKTIFIYTIFFILINVTLTSANTIFKSIEKSNECDIPTWYEGDEWIYTADPVYFSGDFGSFSGSIEDLKQKVLGITNIIHNENEYEVYEIDICGTISGIFTYESVSGDLDGVITGTSYIRVSDLARLKTDIQSVGSIQIIFVTLDYEATFLTSCYPPLEFYDYPLNVYEIWDISCDINSSGSFYLEGLVNESYSGNIIIQDYMECIKKEDVNVPAGTFNCYELSRIDNSIWYSSEVENNVKSIAQYTDGNNTFHANIYLESFTRATQPVTLTIDIDPYETLPYESVIIYGSAIDTDTGDPIQNQDILIDIPVTGDSWTTTTNSDGSYEKTITAPLIIDDTPAVNELGSDGVIVKCIIDDILSYRLKTLVIIENIAPEKPEISGQINGNVGEEYEYIFTATDQDDNDLWYYIEWGDNTSIEWNGPFESGEKVYLNHSWAEEGTYFIRAKVKDNFNFESDWATLEVTMPLNNPIAKNILFLFFERFPNIFPILRNLFRI